MPRLPTPGSDSGTWGDILNDYLTQALKPDGSIKDNAVTSNSIAPGAVTAAEIAPDTITATQIADGSITEAQLDAAVQSKLNTAGSGGVADGTITTAKLQDGAVTDIKVSGSAAIAQSKIANLTSDLAGKAAVSHTHTASQISDSTATGRNVLTAADAAAARTAIGAGTSSLALGTTSTTAKAGDYTPTKSDVGLGNVDNTSNATERAAAATLTNKTIDGGNNTLQNIPQGSVTNLVSNLSGKAATTTTVTGASSLTGGGDLSANRTISLVNDSATPGNAKYYGTDGSGAKGFYDLPSGAGAIVSTDITDSTTTGRNVLTAADAAAARTAIGAGTSSLAIGTTSTTAKAGDYAPTKSDVGLGNVDNTSNATERAATATLTNKTISGSSNTLSNIPQSAVTNLSTDLSNKADTSALTSGLAGKVSTTVTVNGHALSSNVSVTANDVLPSQATHSGQYLTTDGTNASWSTVSGSGAGDASTNTSTSVDSEVALFSGTAGKTLKRATGSGIATLTSGVLGTTAAPSGTIVGTTDTQTLTGKTLSASSNTISNIAVGNFASGTVVTASAGIASNNNDTTLPTSAAVKSYADSAATRGGMIPAGTKTSNYTAAPNEWIEVDASGGTINITLPASPADGTKVTIRIISPVTNTVNLYSDGTAYILYNGVTNLPLMSIGGLAGVVLSTWQYVASGNYWIVVSYTKNPFTSEILDSTNVGRDLIMAASASAGRTTLGLGTIATLTAPSGTVVGTTDTQTLTGKTISGSSNTLSNIAQSSVTNLTTDLAAKQPVLTSTSVKTSAYSAVAGDLIPADASGGAFTVTLPAAPADKTRIVLKKIDSSANAVGIATSGSDVFNIAGGATSGSLTLQNQAIQLQYAASPAIWYVISTDVPLSGLDARYVSTTATATLTNKTISGASNTLSNIAVNSLSTTGSASSSTYLRGDGAWSVINRVTTNNQTGTTYTLALSDAGLAIELNNASAITLTVPPASSVAFTAGDVIELWQQGAGQVTVAPGSGVTIRSSGAKLKLTGQYSGAALRYRGSDEWVLVGDLTP